MEWKESRTLEWKESYSPTVLKTISAYANFRDGLIYIGVDDCGKPIGIKEPNKRKLDIENSINDSIKPIPDYEIGIIQMDGVDIIEIKVRKGSHGPYFYKNVAYVRNDTSSIPVDSTKLTQLILTQRQWTFDQLPFPSMDLHFTDLEKAVQELGIPSADSVVLQTLGLMKDHQYNHAAALLADEGPLEFAYVDCVKFGLDESVFLQRNSFAKMSVLRQFTETTGLFRQYYMPYQIVEGIHRHEKERIPLEAFREALANAIVHRDYLISSGIQLAMFDHYLEIVSPGGLPEGMTESMYFQGFASVSRNPILSYLFYRLGWIERFGTGVRRILESYRKYGKTPTFQISEHQIRIILPVVDYDYSKLRETEAVNAYLSAYPKSSRLAIEQALRLDKSTMIRLLNQGIEDGKIEKQGNGPFVVYSNRRFR